MGDVKMLVIMGVIFLVFLLIIGGIVFYVLKKSSLSNEDTSMAKDIENAQSFLPFRDIKDSMMDLGNYEYRAVLECQSINYDLRTEQEKEMIDASFQRFLDSLTFPITLHIQTKTIDNTKTLQSLENDMVETIKEYNQLYDYAVGYFEEMSKINELIGNTKQKKKYIIVPFSESGLLTQSSEEEKYQETLKGMYSRCQIIIDGLSTIGVNVKIMTSIEIAEMLYSSYHRDNYSDISQIVSAEYMELIVESENSISKMSKSDRMNWIIYECENRLKTEILGMNLSEEEKQRATKALDGILEIKKNMNNK